MGDRGPPVREPPHIVVIQPHCVGAAERRTENTQPVKVPGERRAVAAHGGHRLHLGLRKMRVKTGPELTRQVGGVTQEFIAAQ